MKVTSAEFVKGIRGTNEVAVNGIPHVAFVGRSNVGKSSLIANIVHDKSLVKVSNTPGKTREINFFLINKKTANRPAKLQRRERACAALLEPLNNRHAHEKVAKHARSERDNYERRIEAGQRIDLAEGHKPDAEQNDSTANNTLRAEAVDHPSERRAEYRGFR